jgi:hypothetical protein
VPGLKSHGDTAESEGICPLTTTPAPRLHQLARVVISREACQLRALVALVHLHNSRAVGLFSSFGSVTALARCAAGVTVLTRCVVDPRKVALEPTAHAHACVSKVGFKVK